MSKFFLFDDSPTSEFYNPTFRNTLFHLHRWRKDEKKKSVYKIQTPENHPKLRRILQTLTANAQRAEMYGDTDVVVF